MGRRANADAPDPAPSIPWQDRPLLTVQTAATLLACSPAKIYALANAGKLTLANVTGRTSVRTEGVVKLMHDAQPWAPGDRNKAAVAERQRRAAARIAS